ncbi:MAG: Y-family DNA polymerase [Alphaproteobacteria bacterium]
MRREPGIKWLFMDLNSYFASVEQQENPNLRGKPVIVTPMQTDYTCAIAASYEAKAYGIKTGTMVSDAKNMCPNLHCVQAQHDTYVAYHNRIIEEVVKHTPINRIWSIDELSSRIPPAKRTANGAQKIAKKIKDGLHENIGEAINCSIGFAPNSLLAKIACEMHKPDGLTILRQEDLPHKILHLQLTDIPGIGKNIKKRLNTSRIYTVEDFWNISPKHARKIWGSVAGERFWYLIHGYDIEPQETNTSLFGHSRVLDPDLRTPEKARLIARKLTSKAAKRMRSKEYYAQNISLSVRTKNNYKSNRCCKIYAAQDTFTLIQFIDGMWYEILQEIQNNDANFLRNNSIKKVSISLSNLIKKEDITDEIFHTKIRENLDIEEHKNALTHAIDSLQQKYKKDVVSLGTCPKTSAGFVGTKISFSRVPDAEEFWS